MLKKRLDIVEKPSVIIGNDVWIGQDVTILKGCHIGNGAVLASNSVITKDVPDYAIVGGIPAKIIKYRFSEEIIKKLLKLQWWDLSLDLLENIPFDDIEEAIKILELKKKDNNRVLKPNTIKLTSDLKII